MGKTPVPLVIVVDREWENHPKIEELRAKEHSVYTLDTIPATLQPDLILSRASWNWSEDMWPMLEVVLTSVRKRKKETK